MKLANRQQLLGLVAIAAVALLAGDRLLFTPLVAGWKQRATRVNELKKSVTQGTVLLEREESIRSSWDRMRTNTLAAEQSVAENQMLRAFDRCSQESRIGISSIKPQLKRGADDYSTLECRIDAQGNLSALTRFLYGIERDPLALKIEVVDITARDNAGEQLTLGLQVSGLLLQPTKP
jgi:hypothetical protein